MFGLSTLWIKVILIGVMVAAIAAGGAAVIHAFDQVKADKVTIAASHAQTAASEGARKTETAQADLSDETSTKEVTAQAHLAATAAVIKQKVRTHVHEPPPADSPHPGCVTYGLVRQHDAAALGVDPDTLALPAGTSDDACSPVTNADLADAIADNYAAARANAEQLEALEADAAKRAALLNSDPPH